MDIRKTITETVVATLKAAPLAGVQAVVLTGSLARDEATWVIDDHTCTVLGDAEYLVVFDGDDRNLFRDVLARSQQEAESRLASAGVHCRLDINPIRSSYLRSLKPHIFAYELRNCGEVVLGDASILALIPAFSTAEIPREDAFRLLANRMAEQAGAAADAGPDMAMPLELQYANLKFCLDMATSLLLFADRYEPTYGRRAERLAALAKEDVKADWPFPLEEFAREVAVCTKWKLTGEPPNYAADWSFRERLVGWARSLWRWEQRQLSGSPVDTPESKLWRLCARRQNPAARLRGWAYAMRQMGWFRSARYWPRWIRLAIAASPRICIYQAAGEILFRMPSPVNDDDDVTRRIAAWLPVPPRGDGWHELCRAVYDNYRKFISGTQA